MSYIHERQLKDILERKGKCPIGLHYCTSCIMYPDCWDADSLHITRYKLAIRKSVELGYMTQEEAFELLL